MSLDNSVTFSEHIGKRNYRKEAKKIWAQLDANDDNSVDQEEITNWLLENQVFNSVSRDDAGHTITKLFEEIDQDRNGNLDFEEFNDFYKMVQHEKTQMLNASRHHITALPQSVVKFNKKAFTTDAIELQLQNKIQQFTSQDTDIKRQIYTLFKTQVQRAKDHDGENSKVMGVSKRQFNTILMWLGLFATKEQADYLFEKYDTDGDGNLTVHEFLTKARPTDYPGRKVNVGEKYSFRTGKRMYLNETLNGRAVRPSTPTDDVYHVSEKTIAAKIRTNMGNAPGVSQHYAETPLALNDLMKTFAYYDPDKKGYCTQRDLKRALENLNLSVGDTHLDLLVDKFSYEENGEFFFNYPKFCFFCYPGKPANAALPRHTSLQLRPSGYGQTNLRPSVSLDFSGNGLMDANNNIRPGTGQKSGMSSHRSNLSQASARSINARLSHSQRLQPLQRTSGRRTLGSSGSMGQLPRSRLATPVAQPSSRRLGSRQQSRGMQRSASSAQFRAQAGNPQYA